MGVLHSLILVSVPVAKLTVLIRTVGPFVLVLGLIAFLTIQLVLAVAPKNREKFCLLPFLVFLALGAVSVGLLREDWKSRQRDAAYRSYCANNLKQISLSMHNYHDTFGSFPPAYLTNEEGQPLLSWRVLLLPFMDHQELYEQFHLDEPWDSPHNRALIDDMPRRDGSYQCAADRDEQATETNYVMIVGPDTVSEGPVSRSFREIRDGTSHTIAVVEVADSGIQWTEPRDLRADQISFQVNDPERPAISSKHNGGANVVIVDGSVKLVFDKNDPGLIRGMTTIDGGEDVSALNKL
jgi:prepilin-type processing-associated H-X9-DG protein